MRTRHVLLAIGALSAASAATAQPAPGASPFAGGTRMAETELGTMTGRADTALSIRAQNSSNVSGNAVIGNSTTGGISFEAQALSELSGLALLSANTGNNVSINSSLNVNVAITPQ